MRIVHWLLQRRHVNRVGLIRSLDHNLFTGHFGHRRFDASVSLIRIPVCKYFFEFLFGNVFVKVSDDGDFDIRSVKKLVVQTRDVFDLNVLQRFDLFFKRSLVADVVFSVRTHFASDRSLSQRLRIGQNRFDLRNLLTTNNIQLLTFKGRLTKNLSQQVNRFGHSFTLGLNTERQASWSSTDSQSRFDFIKSILILLKRKILGATSQHGWQPFRRRDLAFERLQSSVVDHATNIETASASLLWQKSVFAAGGERSFGRPRFNVFRRRIKRLTFGHRFAAFVTVEQFRNVDR